MKTSDIYWLAGILEGEGWFSSTNKNYIYIGIKTTDLDIVEKVRKIMDWPSGIYTRYPDNSDHKTQYQYRVSGIVAAQWMMTLYTLMGKRRKEKIKQCLFDWQAKTRKQYSHITKEN